MKDIIRIIALVLAVVAALSFCACGKKEEPKAGRPTTYDGKQSVDAILDYAERLEAMGASKAAAQIYYLLPEAALGEMNYEAKKVISANEGYNVIDSLEEAREFVKALREAKK